RGAPLGALGTPGAEHRDGDPQLPRPHGRSHLRSVFGVAADGGRVGPGRPHLRSPGVCGRGGGGMTVLRGRAWVFGEQISTDQILPGRYLDRPYSEVGQFAMAGADEEFAQKVQPGDIVVAGANFGCGSSREAAAVAL